MCRLALEKESPLKTCLCVNVFILVQQVCPVSGGVWEPRAHFCVLFGPVMCTAADVELAFQLSDAAVLLVCFMLWAAPSCFLSP